jgi:hypothetical protein
MLCRRKRIEEMEEVRNEQNIQREKERDRESYRYVLVEK